MLAMNCRLLCKALKALDKRRAQLDDPATASDALQRRKTQPCSTASVPGGRVGVREQLGFLHEQPPSPGWK